MSAVMGLICIQKEKVIYKKYIYHLFKEEFMSEKQITPKKVFFQFGISLFVLVLVINLVQSLLAVAFHVFLPDFLANPWFTWILVAVSFYCIGFPLYVFMMRGLPEAEKGEKKGLSLWQFFMLFLICMAATYIFNILGAGVTGIISLLKGKSVLNPLQSVVESSNIIPNILFGCILSPIIEELVFRKIALDKLRIYGDKTAIWLTALAFGLFHGNLSQFFYAVVLGMIFAYVVIKTNSVTNSIVLHMIINFFGMIIIPALSLSGNMAAAAAAGIMIIFFVVSGLTLFFINRKKISFTPGLREEDRTIDRKLIYLNAGMLLGILINVASMIYISLL